ncbi:MAG: hypothetical protein KDD67_15730 [Ignavibacteriae bacterium]|nr:hypothetical protein [Ignavibacteriota bacterium]MCB9215728.1 hypothetical protein [Ignavibacteria bacterium]
MTIKLKECMKDLVSEWKEVLGLGKSKEEILPRTYVIDHGRGHFEFGLLKPWEPGKKARRGNYEIQENGEMILVANNSPS